MRAFQRVNWVKHGRNGRPLRRKRMIYCVEDDAGIRELVVYTLQNTGLEARGFSDGGALFEALRTDKPQLIPVSYTHLTLPTN